MNLLQILIINFASPALEAQIRHFFDGIDRIKCQTIHLSDQKSPLKTVLEKLSAYKFEAVLLILTSESFDSAQKLMQSAAFDKIRPITLVCAQDVPIKKLPSFSGSKVADFVLAPFKGEDILLRIERLAQPFDEREAFLARTKEKIGLKKIIGRNPAFLSEIDKLPIIAKCDVPVLIAGETGTGKEIVARTIHYLSPRSAKPFVPVNCGAIPNELVENELFGHEKGAFTGALYAQKGLIHEADGGTLFLDEVDSLPLISQVKLLRFLQDKEFRKLGSTKTHKADVRIIAASNHNLEDLVREEKFRPDLFYRLNVMQIVLPPLRERAEDISLLAEHFLRKYAIEFQKKIETIEPEILLQLQSFQWPGNVRELENVIERAVLLCETNCLNDLHLHHKKTDKETFQETFRTAKAKVVNRFERNYLKTLLQTYHGNITQAAKAAGKNRRAFFGLIRKHQINVENFKS